MEFKAYFLANQCMVATQATQAKLPRQKASCIDPLVMRPSQKKSLCRVRKNKKRKTPTCPCTLKGHISQVTVGFEAPT